MEDVFEGCFNLLGKTDELIPRQLQQTAIFSDSFDQILRYMEDCRGANAVFKFFSQVTEYTGVYLLFINKDK